MEQESVNQRLNLLVEHFENGVKAAFARTVGISPQGAQELLVGRKGDPSFKVLVSILESYPTVDANWLVLGRGHMMHDGAPAMYNGRPINPEIAQQLTDMIKEEVAEQMTANQSNADIYKQFNDETLEKRRRYVAEWRKETDVVSAKLAELGDIQTPEAFDLANRLEAIERAISVALNPIPTPSGLIPDVAYRVGAKPDYNKPFDGLLSRRLNVSEKEALWLIENDETGHTSMEGYGYEVNEPLVLNYLRRLRRRQNQA